MIATWKINSEHTYKSFCGRVKELVDKHGAVTFSKPRLGESRSLSQNALFHAWLTEAAAHYLQKTSKMVTQGEREGMKRAVKKKFYEHTGHKWMIHSIINPITKEVKRDFKSSSNLLKGEMFMLMEFFQMTAADDGLILEARGEFSALKEEQNT